MGKAVCLLSPQRAKHSVICSITYLYLVLVYWGFKLNGFESSAYLWSIMYIVLHLVVKASSSSIVTLRPNALSYQIMSIMLCVYGYGLLLALLNGNPREGIVRNFAGMLMYVVTVPFLDSRINKESLTKLLLYISAVTPYIMVFIWYNLQVHPVVPVMKIPILNHCNPEGQLYATRELIYISFCFCLYQLLRCRSFPRGMLCLSHMLVCLFATAVCEASDGDLFGLVLLSIAIIIARIRKHPFLISLSPLIISCLIFYFFISGKTPFIIEIFSMSDGGNRRRLEEIIYFAQNFSLFGHGLGAPLGAAGSDIYNYGTEVIYLNLFHKFGVFAVLILYAYAKTVWRAFKLICKSTDDPTDVIPLACMGYLIPSLANPMLFAVSAVVLHIAATFLLDCKSGRIFGKGFYGEARL